MVEAVNDVVHDPARGEAGREFFARHDHPDFLVARAPEDVQRAARFVDQRVGFERAVARGISALRTDVRDLSKDVTEPKATIGTQADKTRRLETIVYGALATGTAGLITAVVSAVTSR